MRRLACDINVVRANVEDYGKPRPGWTPQVQQAMLGAAKQTLDLLAKAGAKDGPLHNCD